MPLSDYYPDMEGWTPVEPTLEKPNSSPGIPDPNSQINPYLRTTQPLPLQYQQDTMRQYNRPGLSSYRVAPLAPNAQSASVAAVQSTSKIIATQTIAASKTGIQSVGFTAPKEAVITGSPVVAPSGILNWAWASEPPGYIFQSPPPGLSGYLGSAITSGTVPTNPGNIVPAISQTPTTPTSFGIFWQDPAGIQLAPAGWTNITGGLYYKAITGTSTVTLSSSVGVAGQPYARSFSLFNGPAPTLVQSASSSGNSGQIAFGSNNTAGNMIVVAITCQAGGAAISASISDTKGNPYAQIVGMSAVSSSGNTSVIDSVYIVAGCLGGANSVKWQFSSTQTLFNPQIIIAEFGPVATGNNIPFFAPFSTSTLPPINLGSQGNGGVAGILTELNGGTGADLHLTGGPGQVVFNAVVGGPMTVAPYLTLSSKSAAFTAAYQNIYLISTSTGQVNVTLPTAVGASGVVMAFKKISSDANFVNLVAASGQLIDGGANAQFNQQFTTLTIISDGTNWWII